MTWSQDARYQYRKCGELPSSNNILLLRSHLASSPQNPNSAELKADNQNHPNIQWNRKVTILFANHTVGRLWKYVGNIITVITSELFIHLHATLVVRY